MTRATTTRLYDVAVVGAGPGGSAAAHRLAAAGAEVVLLEKAELPRYKTCGGGLVARARRLLPVDVSGAVERECRVAEINALDSGVHLVVERKDPMISMTMRDALDHALVRAAQEVGAELRAGCEVRGVRQKSDRVELETSDGPLSARFVVAADGALSTVARAAGWEGGRRLVPALEWEIRVRDGLFERFSGSARFDIDVLPYGYGWVFPKREHLSIGVASFKPGRLELRALLERYRRRIGIDSIEDEERHGFVIPVAPRREGFVKGRVVLTGDAAGFADPVTGEGISFAVLSGQIAAETLRDSGFAPAVVAAEYRARVAEAILGEIKLGQRLARFLLLPRQVRAGFLRLWGGRIAERLADVFCGGTTYRDLLRDPSFYLKLLRKG
jgi:geranylgeranyl reductase family protein